MSGSSTCQYGCVGESPAFRCVLETLHTIAPRKCTAVLFGESGTGKEMAARLMHALSNRASGPFIPVDCSNLSGELLASELFGHVKGAFTGADRDTLGFFRAADGGTIFLDEIGELEAPVQARLLRVLQESTVTPVGASIGHPVDVRVICATHRDLDKMVANGTFRSDLYYRMNVVSIHLPPLRERRDDVIPLAKYFLHQQAQLYLEPYKQLAPPTERILLAYDWPGNVRELANAMEHAYVLSPGRVIEPTALPSGVLDRHVSERLGGVPTLAQADRDLIIKALRYTHGRKLSAARLLDVEKRRLNRLIRNFGIDVQALKK